MLWCVSDCKLVIKLTTGLNAVTHFWFWRKHFPALYQKMDFTGFNILVSHTFRA